MSITKQDADLIIMELIHTSVPALFVNHISFAVFLRASK